VRNAVPDDLIPLFAARPSSGSPSARPRSPTPSPRFLSIPS